MSKSTVWQNRDNAREGYRKALEEREFWREENRRQHCDIGQRPSTFARLNLNPLKNQKYINNEPYEHETD